MPIETQDLPAGNAGHTVESLTSWLVERVAIYLQREPGEIDPGEPLAEYGMDSVAALSLCGDVEEDFDLVLEPTVAWDYPTAAALAEHVAQELKASGKL
jgi:acyl carrier protein